MSVETNEIIKTVQKMATIKIHEEQHLCDMLRSLEYLEDIKRSVTSRKKISTEAFKINYPPIYKDGGEALLTYIIKFEFNSIMVKYNALLQQKFIKHVSANGFDNINEFKTNLTEFRKLEFTVDWRFICKTLNINFQSIIDEFNNAAERIINTILEVIESEIKIIKDKIINYNVTGE
jgi:hypothetical protein